MVNTRPFKELTRHFTPERLAVIKAERRRLDLVSDAYDDALERMTGKRQAGLEVDFAYLTAEFTEAQWTDYKRLVKQLCAERGLDEDVDEQVDSWREDQSYRPRLVVIREAPPRPPALRLRHGRHRIPLSEDVHQTGSSPGRSGRTT